MGGGGVIIDLKRNEALVNRVTKGGIFLFATFFIRVKKGKKWGVSSYPPSPPPPVFFLLGEIMQFRYAKSH